MWRCGQGTDPGVSSARDPTWPHAGPHPWQSHRRFQAAHVSYILEAPLLLPSCLLSQECLDQLLMMHTSGAGLFLLLIGSLSQQILVEFQVRTRCCSTVKQIN